MDTPSIDLEKERLSSLARPRLDYSAATRAAVRSMDMIAGADTTLRKAKVVESLAPIPYRAWEGREYRRLITHHDDEELVHQAEEVMAWVREAQDKECLHLRMIAAKLAEDGESTPWQLSRPMTDLMTGSWAVLSHGLARVSIRQAFMLNAEAEDHAEHYYAELIGLHPEWEEQPVRSRAVEEYGEFASWADVFRRIALDERDHLNASLAFGGRPEQIVTYDGMPKTPGMEQSSV